MSPHRHRRPAVVDRVDDEPVVTGLLLGLVDGRMYNAGSEVAVDLQPGGSLLLTSDGLTIVAIMRT